MKILLDTNFLIYCAKQKIDYLSWIFELLGNCKIVVLSSVLQELEKTKKEARKGKDKEAAELALQILKKNLREKKIKLIKTNEKGDEAIINKATRKDIVATMDKELREKLKGKARILIIRQKKKLEIL